jgi:CO/xanthine dehydrogenase Mo-binding subunit
MSAVTPTRPKPLERGKVGETVRRADAVPKATGEFAYASDLQRAGMLWGHTLRSPHAHALGSRGSTSRRPLRCPACTPS